MKAAKDRPHVLMISNMYPTTKSYLGIFIKIQIEHLEKLGVRVTKVVKLKNSPLAYLAFLWKTFFAVLFGDYDLIHAHYGFHSALLPALLKRRKPLVVTYHGGDALQEPFRNRFYFPLQCFVIRRADHLIAVSSQVKEFIETRLGGQRGKTTVISCGVDSTFFQALPQAEARRRTGLPQQGRVVFFAGKITFMKGLDVIHHCALRLPEVLFVVAGYPQYKPRAGNCRFIGLIQNSEVPLWLSAADLYFLPSRSEGTPVGILESLSCQRPVVASRIGGCPDLVDDGVNGFLVDIANPVPRGVTPTEEMQFEDVLPPAQLDEIVGKLRNVLEDRELWSAMGRQGREKVILKYDNAIIASKINNVYSQVTRQFKRRSEV